MDYQIDSLDRKILRRLQQDARVPYLELARDFKVAGGTIHSRVNKMKELGIIEGTVLKLNRLRLGYSMTAFVGVKVDRASHYRDVAASLTQIDEITEIHYTTGDFALFLKVCVRDTSHLQTILSESIQGISQVHSTHTIVILGSLLERELSP